MSTPHDPRYPDPQPVGTGDSPAAPGTQPSQPPEGAAQRPSFPEGAAPAGTAFEQAPGVRQTRQRRPPRRRLPPARPGCFRR